MIFSVIWNKITDPVKYRMILFLILLPASQVLLLLGIYNPDVQSRMKNILISGTACLISVVSVDYIMYRTVNQSIRLIKNEQELEFLKMQRKLQFSYYQLAAENAQKTSALKHELSNQMQTAFALLEQGGDSRGKATALLEQIRGGIRDIDQIVYCGNPIINTVLAIKTAEAKRAGIQTDIRIGSIESIVIADMDLCSIFSNLYDNAIEACRACPGGDAVITVKAGEKSGYLVIRFTNTWNSDLELHTAAVETSKADKRSHGYGLKLVRTIAQKYNGDVVVNGRNRIFEITVSLKISLKIY